MLWWQCPAAIADAPELWRLASALDVQPDEGLACLVRFYSFVARVQERGILSADPAQVAATVLPRMSGENLLRALSEAHVIAPGDGVPLVLMPGQDGMTWADRHAEVFRARERASRLRERNAKRVAETDPPEGGKDQTRPEGTKGSARKRAARSVLASCRSVTDLFRALDIPQHEAWVHQAAALPGGTIAAVAWLIEAAGVGAENPTGYLRSGLNRKFGRDPQPSAIRAARTLVDNTKRAGEEVWPA